MKSEVFKLHCQAAKSLPVRGAWIEMLHPRGGCLGAISRSPCGERGLKYHVVRRTTAAVCRSPCGERGLKFRAAEEATIRGRRSPCGERGLKCFILAAVVLAR